MTAPFVRARGPFRISGFLVAFLAATSITNALQAPAGPGASRSLGELPLSFVENRGQWDTPARFVARRGPMVARLEQDALVVELRDGSDPENPKALVLRLAFEGVNEDVRLEGEGQQPGVRNYFLGNDPEGWRTGVPGFDSVLYRGLYEGIDLRVRDRDGRLEYDLLLAPGADLSQFVVRCEGVESLAVEPDGSLALATALGPMRQTPPTTWYVLPSGEREPVDCRFVLVGDQRYGFEIPGRDPCLPVVIDPGIEWCTFLGGSVDDQALTLELTAAGHVIVGGLTFSDDFPVTDGSSWGGNDLADGFVACLDPAQPGTAQLCWATFLGGSATDRVMGLALDDQGNPCLVGQTDSPDFPTTLGACDPSHNGGWDAFVARLGPSGTLLFSTFLGGSGADSGQAIAVFGPDSVALAGATDSANFPATHDAYDTSLNDSRDFFVALLDLSGNCVTYASFLGGTGGDGLTNNPNYPGTIRVGFDVTPSGDLLLAGGTSSDDFPTVNAYDASYNLAVDACVALLSPDGNGASDLLYSSYVGGAAGEYARGVIPGPSGTIDVAGYTFSNDFPSTPNAFDPVHSGVANDVFLLRLDPSLQGSSQLVYSTFVGNQGGHAANVILDDGSGGWITIGSTIYWQGHDFPQTCTSPSGGVGDFESFYVQLEPAGNGSADLIHATLIGGAKADGIADVELVSVGPPAAVVACGFTESLFYPTTPDAFQPDHRGAIDGYVLRKVLGSGVTPYCATSPNSVGPGALISSSCDVSIGANVFLLSVTGAIPGQSGLFYYGPAQSQVPFGDGFRCVAPGTIGVFRLNPPLVIDGAGAASRLVDFTQPPAGSGPGQITAGSTWNFQFWYRDPAGPGGTTFNLSDALSVTFTP